MAAIELECPVVGCDLGEAGGKYKTPPLPSEQALQLLTMHNQNHVQAQGDGVERSTMTSKVGQLKPFMIEEKKEGPQKSVSEVTANKWQGCMVANIKKEEKWVPLMSKTWEPKKITNRGLTGATAAQDCIQVDQMLEYVSQYAPNALYRDITLRATSLSAVWTLVRAASSKSTSQLRIVGKNTLLEIIIEVEYFQAGEGGRVSTYWMIINVT